jgi:hypothetical protein
MRISVWPGVDTVQNPLDGHIPCYLGRRYALKGTDFQRQPSVPRVVCERAQFSFVRLRNGFNKSEAIKYVQNSRGAWTTASLANYRPYIDICRMTGEAYPAKPLFPEISFIRGSPLNHIAISG